MTNQKFKIGDRVQFNDHDEQCQPCITQGVVLAYVYNKHNFHPDGYIEVLADGDRLCTGNGDGYTKIGPATIESVGKLIDYIHRQESEQIVIVQACRRRLVSLGPQLKDRKIDKEAAQAEIKRLQQQKKEAQKACHQLAIQKGHLKSQQRGLETIEKLWQQQRDRDQIAQRQNNATGRQRNRQRDISWRTPKND